VINFIYVSDREERVVTKTKFIGKQVPIKLSCVTDGEFNMENRTVTPVQSDTDVPTISTK
jgi:hypothetical protein